MLKDRAGIEVEIVEHHRLTTIPTSCKPPAVIQLSPSTRSTCTRRPNVGIHTRKELEATAGCRGNGMDVRLISIANDSLDRSTYQSSLFLRREFRDDGSLDR